MPLCRRTSVEGLRLEDLDAPKRMRMLEAMTVFPMRQIAHLTGTKEVIVRACRKGLGVVPTFKTVDTCAAEFAGNTEYHYKTYETPHAAAAGAAPSFGDSEIVSVDKPKAMILGAGPNRIGQGIEFDYCCVHASYALHEAGYETIMVNCNPETVSTDYDTSDRLYFEPLTFEDVMDIVDVEQPDGVVVTLGGQTPLKLAHALQESGVTIMGTSPEADRPGRRPRTFQRGARRARHHVPRRRHGHRASRKPNASPIALGSRCSFARATCSAVAAWKSPTTRLSLRTFMAEATQHLS